LANRVLIYLFKIYYWIAAWRLKHALRLLVKKNAKLLYSLRVKGQIRSNIRTRIDVSQDDYELLFKISSDIKGGIDLHKIEYLYEKLQKIQQSSPPLRLSYDKAIELENEIIRLLFYGLFHIVLDQEHLNVLKYYNSPIQVLQMFVGYCMKYKRFLQDTLYSLDEIFDMYITQINNNVNAEVSLLSPLDKEISKQQDSRDINKYKLFKKLQAIKAKNLGKKIHMCSIEVLTECRRNIGNNLYEYCYCELIANRKRYIDLNKRILLSHKS